MVVEGRDWRGLEFYLSEEEKDSHGKYDLTVLYGVILSVSYGGRELEGLLRAL